MVEAPKIRIIFEIISKVHGTITNITGTSYLKMGVNLSEYEIRKWWFAGKYIFVYVKKLNEPSYVIRTHMLMFGRITLDLEPPDRKPSIMIMTQDHILRWYASQIKLLDPRCSANEITSNYGTCSSREAILNGLHLRTYDVSHPKFNRELMMTHVKEKQLELASNILVDFLLDQSVFPGVGNIVQQEALFACSLCPYALISSLSGQDLICLIDTLVAICQGIYRRFKENQGPTFLNAKIYHKKTCPNGHKTFTKYLGLRQRRTTWCEVDQCGK